MTLQSPYFLLFAAGLVLLYYLVPKKCQWGVLLAGSWGFYLWAGAEYFAFLLFTTLTTHFTAGVMAENWEAGKAAAKKRNRPWLIACLVVNFGILLVCKALIIRLFSALAQGTALSFLTLGLPMGISFYLFQSMGYAIDVCRGTVKAEKNFFKFALFVSWFPQLIQGPISKFAQLGQQLTARRDWDGKNASFGAQRMLWGYFKKLVIADRIAPAVLALRTAQGGGFWLLTIFYAIQLYGDFTGGIDITLGLSQIFGVKLPENFIRPFFSKNIAEYWRRWHISLGEWMKDYIFYPISVSKPIRRLSKAARKRYGNFGKRLPVYAATIATWLVTGIWHGLTPNFVLWGMLNCLFIIGSQELAPLYARFHGRFHLKDRRLYGVFEMARMFLLMNFIRACDLFPNVGDYFRGLGSLFAPWPALPALGIAPADWVILLLGCGVVFAVSVVQEKKGSVRELLWQGNAWVRYGLLFALVLAVVLFGRYGVGYDASSFIYNQF